MAMKPGTEQGAAEAAENPNAGQGENDTSIDTGTGTDTGADGTDTTESDTDDGREGDETGTETEAETEPDGDGNGDAADEQDAISPRERQLQLKFDRSQTELGALKKALGIVLERMKSARVGAPTAEELAENPDEAAAKEKALQDQDAAIESEIADAGNRMELAKQVPDFDAHVPAMVEFFKQDGADPQFIEAFKKNPYMVNAGLARFVTRIIKAEKEVARLKGTKPMSKPAVPDKKFTPTNDRSGRAPADSKGPVNYKSLAEAIVKDPSSVDGALEGLTTEQINALLAEDRRIAQAKRRRT